MVIQKAINNLKEQPKDDKKAVAGGIAISVVVIIFFAWAFFFVRKLQHSSGNLGGGAQSEFNFKTVNDAQQQLMQNYGGQSANQDELQGVHDQSVSQQFQQPATDNYNSQYQGGPDQFGSTNSSY